jgi:uncharacterized Zn finger protein
MEAKAEAARKKLQKKNPNIRPVMLKGRVIAQNWWGKAWCQNLERYAEYAPLIEEGRRRVRSGTVLDLQITAGQVTALVQGSREKPYKTQIHIDRIAPADWRTLRQACQRRIDSVQALLDGAFPKTVADLFTRQGQGLFPLPEEIHFECTCPEGRAMCKHVMAVLYGVGARLDEAPEELFVLRRVHGEDLVEPAAPATDPDPSDEMAEASAAAKVPAEPKRRAARAAAPAPPPTRRRRVVVEAAPQPAAPPKPPKDARGRRSAQDGAATEKIVALIRQSVHGIDTATLQRRTGLAVTVIRNVIYAAQRKGLIRRVGWGLYKGA